MWAEANGVFILPAWEQSVPEKPTITNNSGVNFLTNQTSLVLTGAAGINTETIWISKNSGTFEMLSNYLADSSTWSNSVPIEEGINTFSVLARSKDDVDSNTDTINIFGDTTAPQPQSNPTGGNYNDSLSVTLSLSEPGDIHYTINNSELQENSPVYEQPLEIKQDTVLKFQGTDLAGNKSGVQTEIYFLPPQASIINMPTESVLEGEEVNFQGEGSDGEGEIVEYRWESDRRGLLSNQSQFNMRFTSLGEQNISFSVKDNEGVWSTLQTKKITVKPISGHSPFKAGDLEGFGLWYDWDWHKGRFEVWSSAKKDGPEKLYKVIVSSNLPLAHLQLLGLERGEGADLVAENKIEFSGQTDAGADGILFYAPAGAILNLEFYLDGQLANREKIRAGAEEVNPQKGQFSIQKGKVEKITLDGPPAVEPDYQGYWLWKDEKWHLRTQGPKDRWQLYSGILSTNFNFQNITPFDFELGKEIYKSGYSDSIIYFQFRSQGDLDGLDFTLPEDATLSLMLFEGYAPDTHPVIPSLIKIGPQGLSPLFVPFSL
ncbi:chitobiase/beta-hexosaminidase C-terminal domain-containing protein [Candidatus Berkelbacteria bacterium]|nr:chitobiase/beta-hexosaminidase C-terminal domain-containing protein [Candidatus Berkelbacteria bacterium]